MFGENSGASIFIVSATFAKYGSIVHVNEEVETLLGYKPRELIGRNISCIMPTIIGLDHNSFIERYLESGRQHILGTQRQLFAVNNEGFLQPIELMIKVHPDVAGRILFIGLMRRLQNFELMQLTKQELQGQEQHYIITDQEGFISNVSDGLMIEMGLHPRFFNYTKENHHSLINIQQLCSNILDADIQVSIENDDGSNLIFNTTTILDTVELEKLSSEEIVQIKSSLGIYKPLVQLHKLVLGKITALLFRIIMSEGIKINNDQNRVQSKMDLFEIADGTSHAKESKSDSRITDGSIDVAIMSSISSTSSSSATLNNMIKNLKSSLSEKQIPGSIILLNKMICFFLIVMIILQSTDFALVSKGINMIRKENLHDLNSEIRTLSIVLIASNVRSLINIGNGLEIQLFEINELNRYNSRFEYLGRLISEQEFKLTEVQNFMSQQRVDAEDAGSNSLQSQYEFQNVTLFRLDDSNRISTFQLAFRVAFFSYLNQIGELNQTTESDLKLPMQLIQYEIQKGSNEVFPKTTLLQKSAFSLLANGFRSLRQRSIEAEIFQESDSFQKMSNSPYLIIMIFGIAFTTISIVVILYQIWQIECIQGHILSVYAHLSNQNIREVYSRCCNYMDELINGSIISFRHIDTQTADFNKTKFSSRFGTVNKTLTEANTQKNQNSKQYYIASQQCNPDDISEEEKEQFYYQSKNKVNSKRNSSTFNYKSQYKREHHYTDLFDSMIKTSIKQIKQLNENQKNANDVSEKPNSDKNLIPAKIVDHGPHSPSKIKMIQKKFDIKKHHIKQQKTPFFPADSATRLNFCQQEEDSNEGSSEDEEEGESVNEENKIQGEKPFKNNKGFKSKKHNIKKSSSKDIGQMNQMNLDDNENNSQNEIIDNFRVKYARCLNLLFLLLHIKEVIFNNNC